ncbi:hypothetical protein C2S53_017827 [Perilla frutescens var. hirtella]|uniref:Phytocyanin domain-containing protein n=1 Tax=Perilla frutescens var. hirtella TaxID=608512 RepID=A0AAD4IXH9_PERFH|nr:hypothetical protein C2S53_017827 [Perilla frutescens var. hirtella]
MADLQRSFIIYFVLFSSFACTLQALQFVVGGRDGWVLNPFENYNHWAQRMRFQVNDTLLFKYQRGSESVLVVDKDDYEKCNTGNPILKLQDGNSIITFDRSGLFFFISGSKSNCANGQKLIIAVLAVRNNRSLSPLPPRPIAPPPETESPAASTTSPSSPPAEAHTPTSSGDGPSAVPGSPHPAVIDYVAPSVPHRSFATAASVSSVVLVSMISLGCISIIF